MGRKVTEHMEEDLSRDYTTAKIKAALKQMYPIKAPRPDGKPSIFYQKHWLIVGPMISKTLFESSQFRLDPPD